MYWIGIICFDQQSTCVLCSRQWTNTQKSVNLSCCSRSHQLDLWISKNNEMNTRYGCERMGKRTHSLSQSTRFIVHICKCHPTHRQTRWTSIHNCHSINWNRVTQLFALDMCVNVKLIKSCLVWFHSPLIWCCAVQWKFHRDFRAIRGNRFYKCLVVMHNFYTRNRWARHPLNNC